MEGLNCGEMQDVKAKDPMAPAATDADIQEHAVSVTHDRSGDT